MIIIIQNIKKNHHQLLYHFLFPPTTLYFRGPADGGAVALKLVMPERLTAGRGCRSSSVALRGSSLFATASHSHAAAIGNGVARWAAAPAPCRATPVMTHKYSSPPSLSRCRRCVYLWTRGGRVSRNFVFAEMCMCVRILQGV